MRSQRRSGDDQGQLALDLTPSEPVPARTRRRPRTSPGAVTGSIGYRMPSDELASRGWPTGTELVVDPSRRPRRGQVALVREGGRTKVGVFDVQFGRAALRTDRGSVWLGASVEYVGVVTWAGPPLAGMPERPG